MIIVDFFESTQ